MVAPAAQEPVAAAREGTRLRRVVSKIKAAWKKASSRTRKASTKNTQPATSTPPSAPIEAPAIDPAVSQTPVAPEEPAVQTIMISHAQAERVRTMSERFNLPITLDFFSSYAPQNETSPRVYRPTRMRIHRSCHRCNTVFRGSRVCAVCQHQVCTLCQTSPRRRPDSWEPSEPEQPPPAVDVQADNLHDIHQHIVWMRASQTSGQPFVRKLPRQRVRRTCHACSTLFPPGGKICNTCYHARCVDCPRFPAKKKAYPDGYPGDEPSSTSTAPIKYSCHICHLHYPPVPHPQSPEGLALGDTIEPLECARCGHSRCTSCRRARPRKVKGARTPDPSLVQNLDAKLAALQL